MIRAAMDGIRVRAVPDRRTGLTCKQVALLVLGTGSVIVVWTCEAFFLRVCVTMALLHTGLQEDRRSAV